MKKERNSPFEFGFCVAYTKYNLQKLQSFRKQPFCGRNTARCRRLFFFYNTASAKIHFTSVSLIKIIAYFQPASSCI